jgi:hypothetical protein
MEWWYEDPRFPARLFRLILILFASAFNVSRALPQPPLSLHPAAHSLRQNQPGALRMRRSAATRLQRCIPGASLFMHAFSVVIITILML